jgi:hypothetical protein
VGDGGPSSLEWGEVPLSEWERDCEVGSKWRTPIFENQRNLHLFLFLTKTTKVTAQMRV